MGILGLGDDWTAALLDVAGAVSGGDTNHYGKYATRQTARRKRDLEEQKHEYEKEKDRLTRADQKTASEAIMIKGKDVKGGYSFSPDEMFYDPATEWGQGPQEEVESLLGSKTIRRTPDRLPTNRKESFQAGMQLLNSGVDITPEMAGILQTLFKGTALHNVAAGTSALDTFTGQPTFSQPPTKIQELQSLSDNPGLRELDAQRTREGQVLKSTQASRDREREQELAFLNAKGLLTPEQKYEWFGLRDLGSKGRMMPDATGAIHYVPGRTYPDVKYEAPDNDVRAAPGGAIAPKNQASGYEIKINLAPTVDAPDMEPRTRAQATKMEIAVRNSVDAIEEIDLMVKDLESGKLKLGWLNDWKAKAASVAAQGFDGMSGGGTPGMGAVGDALGQYAADTTPGNWKSRSEALSASMKILVNEDGRMSNEAKAQLLDMIGAATVNTSGPEVIRKLRQVQQKLFRLNASTRKANPALFGGGKTKTPAKQSGTDYSHWGVK